MSKILWSSRFELGISFIDEDHKTLVSLLNRMNDASRVDGDLTDVGGILSALVDYTRYHFAREERAQKVAGYPDADDHKQQHIALAAKAQSLFEEFREDPSSIDLGDVLDFLSDWLMDHILLHDMAIKPYVQSSREAVIAAENVTFVDVMSDTQSTNQIDWGKLSILIVEDSKAFASVLQAILRSIGVGNITVTYSVEEATQAIEAQSFDMVLSDWRIANKEGTEVLNTLRANGSTTPMVMLTGYVDEGLESVGVNSSVSEWLQKPITSTELTACLVRNLS